MVQRKSGHNLTVVNNFVMVSIPPLQAAATDPDYVAFVESCASGDVATFDNFSVLSPGMRDLVLGALCPNAKERITMQTLVNFLVSVASESPMPSPPCQ
jgi:hypothetical protein